MKFVGCFFLIVKKYSQFYFFCFIVILQIPKCYAFSNTCFKSSEYGPKQISIKTATSYNKKYIQLNHQKIILTGHSNALKISGQLRNIKLTGLCVVKWGYITVKPLITTTSKEFINRRILPFLLMECCRYLVF